MAAIAASTECIHLSEVEPHILKMELSRPERLNAISIEMFDELRRVVDMVDGMPDVRAVVLTGAGRGFCAGMDLDDVDRLPAMTALEMLRGQETWAAAVSGLCRLRAPVIAAINGPAAGAGFVLALASDIRIASTAASFHPAFVRIGLTGGDVGVSWLLPRIVGLGHAMEILLTAEPVQPERALQIGLVSEVTAPEQLLDAAIAKARLIARHTQFGVELTKQVLHKNIDAPSIEAAIELENRNQVLATRTSEMIEALHAFRSAKR